MNMPKIFNITLNNTFKKNNERSVFLLHVYFTHPDFFASRKGKKKGKGRLKQGEAGRRGNLDFYQLLSQSNCLSIRLVLPIG